MTWLIFAAIIMFIDTPCTVLAPEVDPVLVQCQARVVDGGPMLGEPLVFAGSAEKILLYPSQHYVASELKDPI